MEESVEDSIPILRREATQQSIELRIGSEHEWIKFARDVARAEAQAGITRGLHQSDNIGDALISDRKAREGVPEHPLGEEYEKWLQHKHGAHPYTESYPRQPSEPFQPSDVEEPPNQSEPEIRPEEILRENEARQDKLRQEQEREQEQQRSQQREQNHGR